jgi:hypothetical protein
MSSENLFIFKPSFRTCCNRFASMLMHTVLMHTVAIDFGVEHGQVQILFFHHQFITTHFSQVLLEASHFPVTIGGSTLHSNQQELQSGCKLTGLAVKHLQIHFL